MTEGRRKIQDTVVGDNPNMHLLLTKFGYEVEGRLIKQTASGKDIINYATFLDDEKKLKQHIQFLLQRKTQCTFEIAETDYTVDLLNKNNQIYHNYHFQFNPKATLEAIKQFFPINIINFQTKKPKPLEGLFL